MKEHIIEQHHIIIKRDGKRYRTSRTIPLTIEQHANRHKRVYDKFGFWEDKLAWEIMTGRIGTDDKIKKRNEYLSMARKGVPLSEQHKENIRQAAIGRKHPPSQKIKVAKKMSRKHEITDPEGNVFVVDNLNEFCRSNGLDQGNMSKVSLGYIKQSKGYKCRKLDK